MHGGRIVLQNACLPQVVLHVPYIVLKQPGKRYRSFAAVVAKALHIVFGNAFHDFNKMAVVLLPKLNYVTTLHIAIPAGGNPVVLVVLYMRNVFKLRAHKPLMVVGRTVYKVAYDLLLAPLARSRLTAEVGPVNSVQLSGDMVQQVLQLCERSIHYTMLIVMMLPLGRVIVAESATAFAGVVSWATFAGLEQPMQTSSALKSIIFIAGDLVKYSQTI